LRTVLAQISDPHLGDDEAAAAFSAAIELVARFEPDAVLVSGDIANQASVAVYEQARELLAPLSAPVYVLAGNHDDPELLHRHFGQPDSWVETVGELRLIACHTSIPGRDDGALGAERLAWLETQLAADTETPTILAMHHPPIRTGVPVIDDLALAEADRVALGELVARSPQLKRIVGGHVHRAATGELAGCPVFVCPSTSLQLALDLDATEITLIREPPCVALHVADGGALTSHLQPVGDYGEPFVP